MPSDAEAAVRSNGQFSCKFSVGGCERYGQEVCQQCNEPFCPDHASDIDPKFCRSCLSAQSIELQRDPLVDDDGVEHKGAVITPVGATYKSLAQRIVEMSDEALKNHIQNIKQKVKEAEAVLDYRRIDLATSEVELEQRELAERKKLRGVRVTPGKIAIVASGGVGKDAPKKTQSASELLAGLLKTMGIEPTPENITKFAGLLAAKVKK